jgi:hypothetical protein
MIPSYRTRRIVFREFFGMPYMAEYALEHGWRDVASCQPDPAREVQFEHRWWLEMDDVTVHFGIDDISRHSFFFVMGADRDKIERVATRVAADTGVWTLDEAVDAVESAARPTQRGLAILRLGLGAPDEFDEKVFRQISAALLDDDQEIRNIGVFATTYSPLPQYRSILLGIQNEDPIPDIRNAAAAALTSYDTGGVPEQ